MAVLQNTCTLHCALIKTSIQWMGWFRTTRPKTTEDDMLASDHTPVTSPIPDTQVINALHLHSLPEEHLCGGCETTNDCHPPMAISEKKFQRKLSRSHSPRHFQST